MSENEHSTSGFDWLERLRNAYAIHNVVTLRPELPIFLILWDKNRRTAPGEKILEWIDLGEPINLMLRPQHFESFYGKSHIRDQHYMKALKTADETGEVVIREIYGTWDLFQPLPREKGSVRAFIHAGHFLQNSPKWETLSTAWHNMTGQEASSVNRDFVHYVRMLLTLPVFDEPEMLVALKEFFALYALYLTTGHDSIELRHQIDELNSNAFARFWPIRDWMESIISPNKFVPPPWHFVGKLTDWMKTGIGINTLPSTAMALMPLDSQQEILDPVRTLLRNAEIQRACIKFAREMPETAATPLQDYGVSLITSSKPGKSQARARLELRERGQRFRDFVAAKFGVKSVVGIGPSLAAGTPLYESHREATLALHMCIQLEKGTLFHDEHGCGEQFTYAQLQQAADELLDALYRDSNAALKLACDRYVQLVLRYTNQRVESVRGQFLATLFQMFSTLQRRNPMRKEARHNFISDLTLRIEETRSLEQLIESFNEALQRMGFVSTRTWKGPNVMLIESTLQYLRENFFERLPLPDVARKAGFSVPVFTRVFKQATGTSYLHYIRTLRVEHAKKLLATTQLPLEQIAQVSGFTSQHQLIRAFKKSTRNTPGHYRKHHADPSPTP